MQTAASEETAAGRKDGATVAAAPAASDGDAQSEASSEAPEVALDQFGRVYPGVRGPVDYGFRCLEGAVETVQGGLPPALLADCKAVFTARQAEQDAAYSSGETYFLRADEEPSSALEQLAQDVFRFHAAGLDFDAARSGAEWWTLVLEEDSGVAFHWDKDYGLEDYGVNVFPHISTVTYLTSAGGPTLVLDKTAPPRPGEDLSGPAGREAFCSRPVPGKHISFDGRLLHNAAAEYLAYFGLVPVAAAAAAAPRVTFLVNVWFNHLPRDAARLGKDVAQQLTPASAGRGLWSAAPVEIKPATLDLSGCSLRRVPFDMNCLSDDEDDDEEMDDGAGAKARAGASATAPNANKDDEGEDEDDDDDDDDEPDYRVLVPIPASGTSDLGGAHAVRIVFPDTCVAELERCKTDDDEKEEAEGERA